MKFEDLNLSKELLRAIEDEGFTTPSDIQEKAIPTLMKGNVDFVGQAQTGTGKTAAFVLPLLSQLSTTSNEVQALILAPTRELANQVHEEIKKFGKYVNVRTLTVYGGTSYEKQINGLRKDRPQIVVGTTGRIMDLMKKGVLKLNHTKQLILDEADEMLNMGFLDDVQDILKVLPEDRNIWMFSATMPKPIINLVNKEFKDPQILKIEKTTLSNADIEQKYFLIKPRHQMEALCRLLDFETDMYGIVFCKTKREVGELGTELLSRGYKVDVLHGDLNQNQRDAAMKKFKSGYISLLICTDVAARGIDVNNLTHVINFGFPQDMESYVHRIGRTGRAGTKGKAYTLIDPNQSGKLRYLERFVKTRLEPAKLPTVAKLKVALVDKELARMASLVETVKEKGEEFKLDETYDHFKESLEGLSRDQILKVLFAQKFRKDLRRYQDLGELDAKQGDRKEKSFSGGGGSRNGRGSAGRNARRGPRRGAGNGSERSSERSSSRGSDASKSSDAPRKRRRPRV